MFYQKHGRLVIALIAIGFVLVIMWFVAPVVSQMLVQRWGVDEINYYTWFNYARASRGLETIITLIPLAISAILILAAIRKIAMLGIFTAIFGIAGNILVHILLIIETRNYFGDINVRPYFQLTINIGIYTWLAYIAFISYLIIMIIANKKEQEQFQLFNQLSEKVCTICGKKCGEHWNKCPYCGGVLEKSCTVCNTRRFAPTPICQALKIVPPFMK